MMLPKQAGNFLSKEVSDRAACSVRDFSAQFCKPLLQIGGPLLNIAVLT